MTAWRSWTTTATGSGPPLVFLQGVIGDGDLDRQALLPHLTGRFTCNLPSLRGRGLSGDHPDLSLSRLVADFLAYLGGIGDPAGLVGWSAGANWALAVAAQSDAVDAVASIEPTAKGLMDEQAQAAFGQAVARAGELADEGNLTAAMRAIAGWPFTDEDIAVAEHAGYFEAAGRYVPNLLTIFHKSREHEGPMPEDPAVLGAISAPVLVLHGSATKLFIISARHVADHVPNGRTRELPGATQRRRSRTVGIPTTSAIPAIRQSTRQQGDLRIWTAVRRSTSVERTRGSAARSGDWCCSASERHAFVTPRRLLGGGTTCTAGAVAHFRPYPRSQPSGNAIREHRRSSTPPAHQHEIGYGTRGVGAPASTGHG